MTPYLQRPIREWTDAAQLRIGRLQDRAESIRSMLESARELAATIRDQCPMSNLSYDNAEALADAIADILDNHQPALERSLKDDAEKVSDG